MGWLDYEFRETSLTTVKSTDGKAKCLAPKVAVARYPLGIFRLLRNVFNRKFPIINNLYDKLA